MTNQNELSLISYVLLLCQFSIILTFGISSLGKLYDLRRFIKSITEFQMLPRPIVVPASISIVSCEILVVILLSLNIYRGFYVSSFLLIMFSLVLIVAMMKHKHISCNCFGPTNKSISVYDVGRNILLLSFSVCGLFTANDFVTPIPFIGILIAMYSSVTIVFLCLNLEELASIILS